MSRSDNDLSITTAGDVCSFLFRRALWKKSIHGTSNYGIRKSPLRQRRPFEDCINA